MAQRVRIDGTDDIINMLRSTSVETRRMTQKALKDSSKVVSRQIRQGTPKRWRRLVKAKVYNISNGGAGLKAGLFNTGVSGGHQNKKYITPMDDWFKAYWINYGTLERRDRTHTFDRPVKHGAKHGGIRPRRFFEAATKGWEDKLFRAFEKSFNEQIDKI